MKMQLVTNVPETSGSSPVYDDQLLEAAAACSKRPSAYEVSLQKLDGTELYEWHYRTLRSPYWYGTREVMEAVSND